jgi:hypothetical protein
MRHITPLICFALLANSFLFAEGTHELAPNGVITIGTNTTTDLAALHINHPNYNFFASYTNPDPKSRLYIHVLNPQTECLYVGFSFSHANENVPNPVQRPFEFRIKDPNGNVVFGPMIMDPTGVNIHNWSEGFVGPLQIHGPGGYDGILVSGTDLASQGWSGTGDYYIEFRNDTDSDLLIDFWDITVADCSGVTPLEKKGRVWSYNWSIFAVNDFGFPMRPFDGAFYVCAPDPDNANASFVTRIDFNGSGFRPAAFNIAFNSFGSMNTGNVAEDRKSVRNANATQSEYSIFLNDPVEICQTAEVGSINLLGVSRCDADSYCIKFSASKAGQIDLLLDFDGGDNIYTPGTADLMISQTVTVDEVNIPTCIAWDGKDGLGNPITATFGTQIPITIGFAQGIYHFPIYDAELMTTGVRIQAIRPAAPSPLLYYDDSNIGVPAGGGQPVTQLAGCATPCHTWTNYTQPNNIGFGNLCTINSWWFSQLIVRQDVFLLPAYYACEIVGPSHFCQGGTSELTIKPNTIPAGAPDPEIIDIKWTGPGIVGSADNTSIVLDQPGAYKVDFKWLTGLGDTCSSSCAYEVVTDPPSTSSIDTLILFGDVIHINGEAYDHGGIYTQTLSTAAGCDSILIIRVRVLNTVIHYNLDNCYSNTGDGSAMDYSEFTPAYLQPLSCADISGSTVARTPPQMNKHSCTPGVNNSTAMCVSSLDGCTYDAGNSASVVFSLLVSPAPDTAVQITGLSFFSQAPVNFNWINGPTGPNNYPTRYGLRVLKNGTEIFRVENVHTTQSWHFENYDFKSNPDFIIDGPATFKFEILPYCLIGNNADVAAYDMDEISILASCISPSSLNPLVSGVVKTAQSQPLHPVEVRLSDDPSVQTFTTQITNEAGQYVFDPVQRKTDHYVKAYKNDDPLNGVSTLDLIRIQKHLLGITPFTTPYEFIAADANRSNSVTAIDLIELRKLILGIYPTLPRNTSWRFGNAKQELDISNPWSLQEVIGIEYLTSDLQDVDFTGIKIGDLNGDVQTGLLTTPITSREDATLHLQFENKWIEAGREIKVDVTAADFNDIEGLQMALKGEHVRMLDLKAGALDVDDTGFYIHEDGTLKISWNSDRPVSFSSSSALFTIVLESDHSGWLSDLLKIDNSVLHSEAYIGDDLNYARIAIGPCSEIAKEYENKLEIYPNPVTNEANLVFRLNTAQSCTVRFFDASGRLLGKTEMEGIEGINHMTVKSADLGISDGLVICQLEANGVKTVQRMVVIK